MCSAELSARRNQKITGGQRCFTAEEQSQQTAINHNSLQPPCSFSITPQRGDNHKQKRIWKVCIYSWVLASAEEVVCREPKRWRTAQGRLCSSWPPDTDSHRLHPGQLSWLLGMLLGQPKAPYWHGHPAAFPGASEIPPVWTTPREMLTTFFLALLSVFTTGSCSCASPLLIFSPAPFSSFTPGISRQGWLRPSGFFWQPWYFQAINMYLLGVSLDRDFSVHGFQGDWCYTCKLISSCRRNTS